MKEFVHLHVHNEFSYLDGFGKSKQYAEYAKELGMKYLALTNHGNVDGAVDFQNACIENDIIPIHGCELYIVKDHSIKEKGDKRLHVTVLVKNKIGWQNLLKMLTIAHIDGFYYRPRVSPDVLAAHSEGLIIMSACSSSLLREKWGIKCFRDLREKINGDLYLEIMPHCFPEQLEVNEICLDIHKEWKLKLVATNDCHYIQEEDSKAQEVLLAIQSKKKWNDPDRWRFSITGLYLKDHEEMRRAFREQGQLKLPIYSEAMANTFEIAEKCKDFKVDKLPVELPEVPELKGQDETEKLKELCEEGFRKKYSNIGKRQTREYRERLKFEFDTITKQGFTRYFLLVWELIKWCKNNDIMVGPGRGSSGGSIVAYLLNITDVDPMRFGLIFARFISPARIDLPDIDMDFEDTKRNKIREHLEELYGENNVAGVSTVSTMKGKGSLRDVSRVFNIPLVDVNKASNCIVVRSGGDFRSDYTISDAFSVFEDGKRFRKKYPEVANLAIKLEGQNRTKGQHAAAIVISSDDLREGKRCNLQSGKNGTVVNWIKGDAEYFGLMKLDVLGLNALTVLNEARKLVKKNKNVDINYNSIPLDDRKVFEEFTKGNCVGCFQLGSLGLRKFCRQIGVDNFMSLVHTTSLYRPGTLRSGMCTEFVKRKRGEEDWESIHPKLDEITKETYGIILYQEQVMQFMYDLGGLGWKTADTVRKVISKSQGVEQFQKFKKMFADGCVERKTLDRETAEGLWDTLSSFGSYSFNKSHAVEYSLITYWDMFMKVHHPYEFICCSLTYGSEQKKEELVEEAVKMGLDVRPPKIGISKAFEWTIEKDRLYCPFIDIKGFGRKTAQNAEKLKTDRSNEKVITKRFLNILNDIKAFEDKKIDEDSYDNIAKYFGFDFINSKTRKIKNLISILYDCKNIDSISNVDLNVPNKDIRLFFGEMTEIKFGYRGKIDTIEKRLGISGTADNLGGVYGNFRDKDDFCMLVFDSNIYMKKKEFVEHCAEELILAKANNPQRTGSILCHDAWFQEEFLNCNLQGLDLHLIKQSRFKNLDPLECSDCILKNECSKPVLNSTGKYNVMIIGEAPGRDEDRKGEGFVGQAGDVVWKELGRYDFSRRDFNISNVVKCWPSETKTPTKTQIKKCLRHIKKEIDVIKPILVLAFGNTCLKAFKEEDSGIMAKSGTTEWIDNYSAWFCWCIHPAAVLYERSNYELFEKGVKNFVEKFKILE
jgi:DNA polymerase-3 subunit alpha